jgi:hypothetical protein
MADHDPKGAAAETAAVKAVELLAACAMVIIAAAGAISQRQASEPDFTATLQRRWVSAAERGWLRAALYCYRRAERFSDEYDRLGHE